MVYFNKVMSGIEMILFLVGCEFGMISFLMICFVVCNGGNVFEFVLEMVNVVLYERFLY